MSITLDPLSAQRGVDLDRLKARFPALYQIVVRQTGLTTGIHALDFNLFLEGSHKYLAECSVRLPAEPQISMAQLEREEQADIQRRIDEAAGHNRLEQYAREQGLEDTQANADAIRTWLQENVKGYLSEKLIDAAVANLGPRGKNVLTWRKPEAPQPPAPSPEPAEEVLGKLPDGTTQLPLDVTPNKKHSTLQLKDWLKRTNANRIIRPSGSFRVSIF